MILLATFVWGRILSNDKVNNASKPLKFFVCSLNFLVSFIVNPSLTQVWISKPISMY